MGEKKEKKNRRKRVMRCWKMELLSILAEASRKVIVVLCGNWLLY